MLLRTNLAFFSSLEGKCLVNYKDSKMTFMDVFLTAFFLTFSMNCPVGMAFSFYFAHLIIAEGSIALVSIELHKKQK